MTANTTDTSWLDTLPVATPPADLLDHPVLGSTETDSVPISARVPASWIAQIDVIRQMPGTMMPDLWPKRSDFVRWCIVVGFREMARISRDSNDPNVHQTDPMLQAQIFLETEAGAVATRARMMTDAQTKVAQVASSATVLIQMEEFDEAAGLVNHWILGARKQQHKFWTDFFLKALLLDAVMHGCLVALIERDLITDEAFVAQCKGAKQPETPPGHNSLLPINLNTLHTGSLQPDREAD